MHQHFYNMHKFSIIYDYLSEYKLRVKIINMNFSQIVEEWIKEPMANYLAEERNQGAFLALVEMTLALIGTVLNLIVLIPIINSSLRNSTIYLLMANLCFANLISAVFVKLIGVIYHGYAVATSRYIISLNVRSHYWLWI